MNWKNNGLAAFALVCVFLITAQNCLALSIDYVPTNVAVDFDETSTDSDLMRGESTILNLVVKNSGGQKAEDIDIRIPSTQYIKSDKKFSLGRLDPEESVTLPVIITVLDEAKTGLSAIQVIISYDGYDSNGELEKNQLTTWEIPMMINAHNIFQLSAAETTYFQDTLAQLELVISTKERLQELEVVFSSECASIIGSSSKYVGTVSAGDSFEVATEIRPGDAGTCPISVSLEYTDDSGTRVTGKHTVGLNIEEPSIDFKVTEISYEPAGPGENLDFTIKLKNVGASSASDTTAYLALSDPLTPFDTVERYIGLVDGGEEVEIGFTIGVGWAAESRAYAVPLVVQYKVGGKSHEVLKSIGVEVRGKVILEIMDIELKSGQVRFEVANVGTVAAEGVKATLKFVEGNKAGEMSRGTERGEMPPKTDPGASEHKAAAMSGDSAGGASGEYIDYKSSIKASKETSFTFDTQGSGEAVITFEYSGANNERVTQTENVTVPEGSTGMEFDKMSGGGKTSLLTYLMYGIIAIVVLIVARKAYRKYAA